MGDAGITEPQAGPLVAGALLGDRYTLTRLIGTGGMASVWAAQDPRLHREVAIKIISDTLALDPTFVDRFAREARIAAGLSHPHVVGVFDYGAHGGRPYLVMEYVPGGTLSTRIKERRYDWDPITLARELLDALSYIHDAGILHRDLKPANVLIGADGRARLTDFGIAHLADGTRLTSTGFVVGTERYIAPEVRRGGPATVVADLYNLGVLLQECATRDAPAALTELIDRLTDPDPTRRPPSAGAALALLGGSGAHPTDPARASQAPRTAPTPSAAALADVPTQAMSTPTGTQPQAPPASRRLSWRVAAAVAAAVLGIVVLAVAESGGGGGGEPLEIPPAGGTLSEQLDQLDDAIDDARR